MALDKVMRGVVHVLAGYIAPNDRLWVYTSRDYGLTWVSVGVHAHSPVGSGWTQFFTTASFTGDLNGSPLKHLVNFRGDLYCTSYTNVNYGGGNVHETGVWRYTGVGVPTCVLDATQGATWIIERIDFLVEVQGYLVAVYNGLENNPPNPSWRKTMAWSSPDGVTWTKILDTSDGTGIGVTWLAPGDFGHAYAAIGANFTLLIGVTWADGVTFPVAANRMAYIWGCEVGTNTWWTEWSGSDAPDGVHLEFVHAFAKSAPDWSVDPDIVWFWGINANSEDVLYTRQFEGVWLERGERDSFPEWGDEAEQFLSLENRLYVIDDIGAADIYETKDGITWRQVNAGVWTALGVFEDRIITGNNHDVYIQSLPDYFEHDYNDGFPGSGIDFGVPYSFEESWDHLWAGTDEGLWRRDDPAPSWRMDMRRSAMANQGHQYSVETLPNVPWIVYVAAARESGGDEYIRLLRIHTENYDSSMSHSFSSGSILGRPGFIRVSAPPRSGSCIDEIIYAFGRGYETPGDPLSNEMVWRFESGQAPADKTDVGWPGYKFDAIQSLLHDGDDQDWVALFNKGAARGTTDGGDNWNDLTDVTILTDGADRVGNEIVAGRYSSGSIMIRYSPDRALNWNSQGDGISTADGIASVQMYDKTRLR